MRACIPSEPLVVVDLTGKRHNGFEEYELVYSNSFDPCLVWLPIGFTPELLEDLIKDVRGE